jgi:ABC-type sugar transport system permease subunit/ABC-type glycerol-3-phosphate transport system substrate-binding protein
MAFFTDCAREYEKLHPDVDINLYGDNRVDDKVRIRVLEGTLFDITNASLNWWGLIKRGDVEPLDAALDQTSWDGDTSWRDSFVPGSLSVYQYQGKTYALPLCWFVSGVWYNKVMFREHGWNKPKTWDEFFQLCDQIKQAHVVYDPKNGTEVAPLAFQGRYPYYAYAFIDSAYYYLAGPAAYRAQQSRAPGSFDNPNCIESLRIMQKIAQEDFQTGAMGMNHTDSQLQFFLGHTAMIGCGAWLKSEMLGKIPDGFQLGFFPYPTPVNAKLGWSDGVYVNTNFYFVMSHAPHKKEAMDFLRFMLSRKMAGKFSRMQDTPTAIRGASEGNLSVDLDEAVEAINNAHDAFARPPTDAYPEVDNAWLDDTSDLLTGHITPEAMAKHLESVGVVSRNLEAHPDEVTVRYRVAPALLLAAIGFGAVYWVVSTGRRLRSASGPRKAKESAGRQSLGFRNLVLFLAPSILIYSTFVIFPSLRSFNWSLHRWDGISPFHSMTYVGFLNFRRLLFESTEFWTALDNNIFLMTVVPLVVVPLSLFLAACVSRGVIGAQLFRIIFFFPNLFGTVAVTLLWTQLYAPQGAINTALVALHLNYFKGFAWLSDQNLYWAVIPISVWGVCGFNMVLYLAAMQNIPTDLYEAATLDGASPMRQFFTITIPLIWEVLTISVVFLVIGGMKAFELIYLLKNQQVSTNLHTISTRMIQVMFQDFRVGEATAIAVMLFLMVFFGTAVSLRVMRRDTVEM